MGQLEKLYPTPVTYTEGVDFAPFSDNGNAVTGDVTGLLYAVPNLGDDPSDFVGFPAGRIALIERGVVFFSTKVNNAAAAGAIGVLIYNNVPGPVNWSLAAPTTIPALGISQALGQSFVADLSDDDIRVRLVVTREAAAVPEPSTLALLGLGGAALAGWRWRRRKTLA